MPGERRVRMGRIVGVSGVRGWVKLESWAEPRLAIFDYQPWLLETGPGEFRELRGARGREQGKGLVAELPGVTDRDQAAALTGVPIWVPRAALPPLGTDEYYWTDLEELEVVTVEGTALGRVDHLFDTGVHPVLVVRDGDRERLIPFVPGQHVRSVDLDAGRIVVDWDPDF